MVIVAPPRRRNRLITSFLLLLLVKELLSTLIQDTYIYVRENVRLYDLSWFCHQEFKSFAGF